MATRAGEYSVPYLLVEGKFDLHPWEGLSDVWNRAWVELSSLNAAKIFPFRWPSQESRFEGSTRTRYPFLIYFVMHQTVTRCRMALQRVETLVKRVQR
jgi:hypothetical protein